MVFSLSTNSLLAGTNILPKAFYSPENICESEQSLSRNFWYQQISSHFESLLDKRYRNTALDYQSMAINQLITESYREFYTSSNDPFIKKMGHVYAHASHHLGRLMRYHPWKEVLADYPEYQSIYEHEKSLIKGHRLNISLNLFPRFLPNRLINFSYDLFKELSWNLLAGEVCGREHIAKIRPQNSVLNNAYNAEQFESFLKHYIRFEQTYLQQSMYSKFDIRSVARAGVLDKIRFIPFANREQVSYLEWCQEKKCQSSSYHLENRINYDIWAINREITKFGLDRYPDSFIDETHEIFEAFLLASPTTI